MPCVQTKIQNSQALLNVAIAPPGKINKQYNQEKNEQNITINNPLIIPALIDTGATGSCISESAAKQLSIQPDGQGHMEGIHGTHPAFFYYIDLILIDIAHIIEHIKVFEITGLQNTPYSAIVGMDIIQRGTLHFNYRSALSPEGICTFCV